MKIDVDGKNLFSLSETKKKVIMNEIHREIFEEDMKRRLQWVLIHKYEQCFKKLKEDWEPKIKAAGIKSFPADEEEFAELIFSQPTYKDRTDRDK